MPVFPAFPPFPIRTYRDRLFFQAQSRDVALIAFIAVIPSIAFILLISFIPFVPKSRLHSLGKQPKRCRGVEATESKPN